MTRSNAQGIARVPSSFGLLRLRPTIQVSSPRTLESDRRGLRPSGRRALRDTHGRPTGDRSPLRSSAHASACAKERHDDP
jgi:hypothetical protein